MTNRLLPLPSSHLGEKTMIEVRIDGKLPVVAVGIPERTLVQDDRCHIFMRGNATMTADVWWNLVDDGTHEVIFTRV